MAVSFVRNHTVTSSKTAGTAIGMAISTAVPAGSLLVARVLFDNAASANTPTLISADLAPGETNFWQFLGAIRYPNATTAGAFANGEMWAIRTTVTWNVGTFAVGLSVSVPMKATMVSEFTGVLATLRSTSGTVYSTTTTAASATTTGTTPVIGDLALGFIFGSNVAAAQAGDNDTTGGAWSAVAGLGSTGSTGATNNFGVAQYKILTTASHQTLNNSAAMSAGNGAIVAILQQEPTITPVASFTASTTSVASGSSVTFTDTSTNTPTTWAWDFGTGASPATASTRGPHVVTFNTVGTSTVTLTAGNTAGSDASDPTDITVTASVGLPIVKAHTVVESFSSPSTDPPWRALNSGASFTGGQMRLSPPPSNPDYAGYEYTAAHLDLTDSKFSFEVVDSGSHGIASWQANLAVMTDPVSGQSLLWQLEFDQIRFYSTVTGPLAGGTYDPVGYRWLQFRVAGAAWAIEVSPDGTNWNIIITGAVSALGLPITDLVLMFEAGKSNGEETQTSACLIDNLNTLGPTGQALTLDRSDALGLTDTVSVVNTAAHSATDTLGITETRSINSDIQRTDALGITDATVKVVVGALTDSVGLTDSVTTTRGTSVSGSDPVALTDSATAVISTSVDQTDSLGVADSRALNIGPDRSDNETLTDSRSVIVTRTSTDPASLSDSITVVLDRGLTTSDTVIVTDSSTAELSAVRSDVIGLTDNFDVTQSSAGNYFIAENVGLGEFRAFTVTNSRTDTAGLFEAWSAVLGRTFSDAFGLTDSRTTGVSAVRADDSGLTDSSAIGISSNYPASDSLGLEESWSIHIVRAPSADPMELVDLRTLDIAPEHVDSTGLDEYLSIFTDSDRTDLAQMTDTVRVALSGRGHPMVYLESEFTPKPSKVWDGSEWVEKPWKWWDGVEWRMLT